MGALTIISVIGFGTLIWITGQLTWKNNELEKRLQYLEDVINEAMEHDRKTR